MREEWHAARKNRKRSDKTRDERLDGCILAGSDNERHNSPFQWR